MTRGPIPKPSNQRHGHRKAEPVDRIPAGQWTDLPDGRRIYRPAVTYPRVTARGVLILLEKDPGDLTGS
jgi:hypothetical protein